LAPEQICVERKERRNAGVAAFRLDCFQEDGGLGGLALANQHAGCSEKASAEEDEAAGFRRVDQGQGAVEVNA